MSARAPDYLEVELGAFCNRQCSWCPNGWDSRGQRRDAMKDEVWSALLADLARSRYRGTFAFHNYNEPLADPRLLERVAQARAAMPSAHLAIFTNGDLLTGPLLRTLGHTGIDEVRITRYPSEARAFEEPDDRTLTRTLKRLGIDALGTRTDVRRFIARTVEFEGMTVCVRAPRVALFGSRAGAVALPALKMEGKRFWPCLQPTVSAAIDFHGNLKICCHIYDTLDPANASTVVGNVGQTPFSTLWRSARLEAIRKALARADYRGMPVCQGCDNVWIPADLPKRLQKHWPEGWLDPTSEAAPVPTT